MNHLMISAPDYRRPEETSNPISMLSLPEMKAMTFKTFQMREDEIGHEAVTTTTTENPISLKQIQRQRDHAHQGHKEERRLARSIQRGG